MGGDAATMALPLDAGMAEQPGPPPARDWSQVFAQVPADWRPITQSYLDTPAGLSLLARLEAMQTDCYPQDSFAALRMTPLACVRAVILGQDPYHGPGQAHGLAFSVPKHVAIPPSLRNIRQELERDLGLRAPAHGDLSAWAQRGVLLLNTCLSVAPGQAASHAGWGWEGLTDALLDAVAQAPGAKVFMLWGAHAQRKAERIELAWQRAGQDPQALSILRANHPSPLSARRGPQPFLGCGHFSLASAHLQRHGFDLNWSLS